MAIEIRLFAALRDGAQQETLTFPTDEPQSAQEVIDFVADQLPGVAGLVHHSRLAFEDCYLGNQEMVPFDGRCDLIPPVSGG